MDAHQKLNEVCHRNLGKPPERILRDDFNAELVRAMVSCAQMFPIRNMHQEIGPILMPNRIPEKKTHLYIIIDI